MITRTILHRTKKQVEDAHKLKPASSNREDIIDFLMKKDFIPNYVLRLEWTDNYRFLEDEIQEIWCIILEVEQETWDKLYNQGTTAIVAYVSGLIFRQIKSECSRVYNTCKAFNHKTVEMSSSVWQIYSETNLLPPDVLQNTFTEDYETKERKTKKTKQPKKDS